MLEIIAIIALARSIKKIILEKGRKPAGYIALMVILWITLELIGGMIAVILAGEGLAVYGGALIGAALGGLLGYLIAKNAKPAAGNTDVLDANLV